MADLETIINSAGRDGWDFFDGVSDEVKRRLELAQAKDEETRRVIAAAWARFAASPDGAQALQLLFGATLDRTVYFINLDMPPDRAAGWGFFREGQNALAQEIARQIARGRDGEDADDKLKPRDTL